MGGVEGFTTVWLSAHWNNGVAIGTMPCKYPELYRFIELFAKATVTALLFRFLPVWQLVMGVL